ncbi:MAG: efflux RND transporter permease subunit [Vulcanimicrobiaceae bacterium]
MQLTRLFLMRPTLVFVLVTLTLLGGILALRNLVVQQQPNNGLPAVSVNAGYSGASTTELVTEIAQPIEDQLAGTPYLDHINTTIQTGSVSITASFTVQSTDTENIANVEKAVQAASRSLPSTITSPTIRVSDPSEPTVVSLALVSAKYPQAVLASIANNTIVPTIEQLPGISNVNVTGTTQPAFMVTVNPALLAADNLTLTDVVNAITPNNIRAPGGYVYGASHETQLDVRGDLPTAQSVANLPIHVTYTAGTSTSTSGATGAAGASSGGGGASGASSGTSATSGATGAAGGGTTSNTAPAPNVTVAPAQFVTPTGAGATSVASATMPPAPSNPSGSVGTASGSSGASTSTASGTSGTSGTSTGSNSTAARSTTGSTGSSTGGTSGATGGTASGATGGGTGGAFASGTTTSGGGGSSASSGGSTGSIVNSESAAATPGVDSAVTPGTVNSNSAAVTASSSGAALPSTSSSSYGSGAGVTTSPLVGALDPWAVPSADKRISDVATVIDGSVIQRVWSSQNGRPGVTLLVQKATQASEVTVANEVIAALPGLRAQFPGVDFQLAHVQATYTEQQVTGVEHTLVEGIILTAVVMLFFLGSWRNAVVVMIAIPTSLGVTLFVMMCMGLTLDTISLMAMTLVIGILIDDSTVVLENIERHHSLGEAPADAALNGRTEIGLAALVLTTVDVIVFLPIVFVGGQVAQLLTEFAIVVTVATLTSLFVSFTITPTLAGLWSMRSTWKPWPAILWFDARFSGLRTRYSERWLPVAFRHPWPFVIVAVVSCVVAFYPLTQTHATMNRLEAAVRQLIPAKSLQYETTVAGAYSAAFGGFVQEGNVGQISVYLYDANDTENVVDVLTKHLTGMVQGGQVAVTAATGQGGSAQQPIDEEVSTTDGSDPTADAAKIFAVLKGTPGAIGAQDSASNAAPQMEVDFDRPRLQALDVSDGTAAAAVEAGFGGDVASQIETPDRGLTDIEVIYPTAAQTSLAQVLAIPIRTQAGGIIRLGDVAYLKWAPAPLLITRENRATIVHVSANLSPSANLSDVTNEFQQRVRAMHLPKSVRMRPAAQGQQDLMGQALQTLGASLAVSIVLVFLVIVALYNSYRTPFVTLFAIPVAAIGGLGALWLTHQTLNLYSLIGTVLLVGLVTKNGILLVDYADTVREREGRSRQEGIAEAAQTRFRPIIMTTVAMIAGMLPLALGLEPGGQQRASLAIVVIGGLLSSLVLTLFIVPIMYNWLAPEKLREPTKFAGDVPKATPAPST